MSVKMMKELKEDIQDYIERGIMGGDLTFSIEKSELPNINKVLSIVEPNLFDIFYNKKEFVHYYDLHFEIGMVILNIRDEIEIDEDVLDAYINNHLDIEINAAFNQNKIVIELSIDDLNNEIPSIVKSKYPLKDEDSYPYFYYILNELLKCNIDVLNYYLNE